ncbi:hypothetical protein RDABS01_005765 [Bienertia sinuspersici]
MVVLCDVCLKLLKTMAVTHISSGKKFKSNCKHKYDTMRKDWRNWKDLKSSETGLGWNPVTGKIDASDELWQRKIKATGKNAFAASLDPDINVEEHDVEYEDFGEDDARNLGSNNYFQSDEFTTELINEDNFFEIF